MKKIALTLAAVLALTGCGAATAERPHAAAPAVTRPADTSREACHHLSLVPDDVETRFDPNAWLNTAQAAKNALDPGVSAAGERLRSVVAANEQLSEGDRQGQPNIDLMDATLKLAQACGNLYGDGPW
jgi:hypothetical protein